MAHEDYNPDPDGGQDHSIPLYILRTEYRLDLHIPPSNVRHTISIVTHSDGQGTTIHLRRGDGPIPPPPGPVVASLDTPNDCSSRPQCPEQGPSPSPVTPARAPRTPVSGTKGKSRAHFSEPLFVENDCGNTSCRTPGSTFDTARVNGSANDTLSQRPAIRQPTPSTPSTSRSTPSRQRVNVPYVPFHLRISPDERQFEDSFNVPAELRERYPPTVALRDDMHWYVIIRGREIGIFYDRWAYVSAVRGPSGFLRRAESYEEALAIYEDAEEDQGPLRPSSS
ncbi:hypothetical protein ONZ45_g7244 [Pleurotus djamor]|nr:hypothetical protein ONZ45_g7244 [Pleurotus djamor]